MLRHILDAHGGRLPDDVHVLFANTGKEREETLAFVHNVETRWSVNVRWIEYVPNGWREPTEFKEVSYETAARNGEPFKALLDKRGYLPGAALRFCTEQLKIIPMKNFMWRFLGYEEWTHNVGLRADEPNRVAKLKAGAFQKGQRWECDWPMFTAGHTIEDVTAFWADNKQGFDLGLAHYQGNCDLCFLKSTDKKLRTIHEEPERAEWWAAREREAPENASSRTFVPGKPMTYFIEKAKDWTPGSDEDKGSDCFCTD
jgi:3'-phosphoadenosine 5'-phosphosulfate sulfotransferase (PAPS reductase)/FAD synthetase